MYIIEQMFREWRWEYRLGHFSFDESPLQSEKLESDYIRVEVHVFYTSNENVCKWTEMHEQYVAVFPSVATQRPLPI